MSIYQHYLSTATSLIHNYDKKLPFHLYLKQYFSVHKKYGSRDRKLVSAFCFNFLRLGHSFRSIGTEERMILAYFLLNNQPGPLLSNLAPSYNDHIHLSFREKVKFSGLTFLPGDIFPFPHLFSKAIALDDYCLSMLRQPDLFIRTRPGFLIPVQEKLDRMGWHYTIEKGNAFRLINSQPVEKSFRINTELVIQDLNSQEVGNVIKKVFEANDFRPADVWDCCAASGGKSIMLYDHFPGIQITVSDVRASILQNLVTRFREAGINAKKSFLADLSSTPAGKSFGSFSFILADVPCTGSGTWARTPEQLYFFEEETIELYVQRQKAIVSRLPASLRPGGWLVYVTCSVFYNENEDVVEYLRVKAGLQLIYQEQLDGTKLGADSMFIAFLKKPVI